MTWRTAVIWLSTTLLVLIFFLGVAAIVDFAAKTIGTWLQHRREHREIERHAALVRRMSQHATMARKEKGDGA